jgi:hypothetical protein
MTENSEPENTDNTKSAASRKELIIGASVVVGIIAIIVAIVFAVQNSQPKIDYLPVAACDLFTQAEARELLGEQAFNSNSDKAVISGDTATSKCGYTDGNPDTNKMVVAAIIVRSGVNDKGVQQNKDQFSKGKPLNGVEDVSDLGDAAYYNQVLGQLNVLKGKNWIIFSYGLGSSPEANNLNDAVKIARKVI